MGLIGALLCVAVAGEPGVYPSTSVDEAALAPLESMIGEAELVAVGESLHASGGMLAARARVTEYLVRHVGFRAIAIEASFAPTQTTDDFVRSCEGRAFDAVAGLGAVYGDTSTIELLDALCAWNREHPDDPVVVFGIDGQQPAEDRAALVAFADTLAEPERSSVREGLDACPMTRFDTNRAWVDWVRETELSESERVACEQVLAELGVLAPPESVEALHVWTASAFFDQVLASQEGRSAESGTARDELMARLLVAQRARLAPEARTVVWAHNEHIAEDWPSARLTGLRRWMAFGHGYPTLGTLMNDSIGPAWFSLALVARETHTAWFGHPDPAPARPRSFEGRIAKLTASPVVLVDLHEAALGSEQVVFGPRTRAVGERVVPGQQFDAALYLDRSPPAAPLTALRRVEAGQDPVKLAPKDDPDEALARLVALLVAAGWEDEGGGRFRREDRTCTVTVDRDEGGRTLIVLTSDSPD